MGVGECGMGNAAWSVESGNRDPPLAIRMLDGLRARGGVRGAWGDGEGGGTGAGGRAAPEGGGEGGGEVGGGQEMAQLGGEVGVPGGDGFYVGGAALAGLVAQVGEQTSQQLVTVGLGLDGGGHDGHSGNSV